MEGMLAQAWIDGILVLTERGAATASASSRFEVFENQLHAGDAVEFVHVEAEGGADLRRRAAGEFEPDGVETDATYRATIGRELDMLDMKKTINALSRELGRGLTYPLAFLKDEGGAKGQG